MSKQQRLELLNEARQVYASKKTRKDKYEFLLEIQQLTRYKTTKTIIRTLSSTKEKPVKEKRYRNHFLKPQEIKILGKLWFAMDQPCGKRLKAILPEWITAPRPDTNYFNSRTRVGCDVSVITLHIVYSMFQFTHPRGVRLIRGVSRTGEFPFQFTHPRGVRSFAGSDKHSVEQFQFTHPRGVRFFVWDNDDVLRKFQFTHPRGVRFLANRTHGIRLTVSIHAPAWGAIHGNHCPHLFVGFQFTHPRGVR